MPSAGVVPVAPYYNRWFGYGGEPVPGESLELPSTCRSLADVANHACEPRPQGLLSIEPPTPEHPMKSFEAVQRYFDRAADQMDSSENMRQLLLTAKREVRCRSPSRWTTARSPRSSATACSTTTPAGR